MALQEGRYAFVADLHLGPDSDPGGVREQAFVQYLKSLPSDLKGLFLLGDIFDFWVDYHDVVPRGGVRVLAALADVAARTVYCGPIDEFYGFDLGQLEYRSLRFESEVLDEENHQGVAVVNYNEREVPWTRIIEHKHFEFGTQPKTIITREYPADWHPGDEPYYPINDERNTKLYNEYRQLAEQEGNVVFAGRLGGYKYYDMDKAIAAAFDLVEAELGVIL